VIHTGLENYPRGIFAKRYHFHVLSSHNNLALPADFGHLRLMGQRTLAWSWPDKMLVGQELTDRQDELQSTGTPGQRTVFISECPGQKGQQYCKRLFLHGAQGKDTGYYRCYYKDINAIIDGITAVSIYAFVRDPLQPFLMRGESSDNLETIFITRFATHVIVPCLVTIPDLNVTLHSVCSYLLTSGDQWDELNVSAFPTPETQWFKDGVLMNQRPEFKKKRIRMHSNHALEIKDVCQEDAGLYMVVLKNSAALLERRLNITLVVNVPPEIYEKKAAAPSSPYRSGSSQTLKCTVSGFPVPNISWKWRAWGPCVINSTEKRLVAVHPSENPLEQEKVSLSCSADNYTYDQLHWYRLNPQALQDQQGKSQGLDCSTVHHYAEALQAEPSFQQHSNSWVLDFTMEAIRLQDEGHYVCKAQGRRSEEKQCLFRYISVKGE
ncbi:hypothetical protein XENOCAPTIV_010523, partial [Xenoophorus captivus]